MTDPQLLREFQRRFEADPDPWGFDERPYEQAKRAATIDACGWLPRRRILELGAANGVLAAELAGLGVALVAIEAVPAAADVARRRLAPCPGTSVVEGLIPDAVPDQRYDLVVASEILYYLDAAAYARTLAALPTWVVPGGRLVAVHWRPRSAERPRGADEVHRDLNRLAAFQHVSEASTDDYRLDTFERR